MMSATEELLSHIAEIDPIPGEENENNVEDADDLHEIRVDDDINEPDGEEDYPVEPGSDNDMLVQSMPEEDED